MEKEDKDLYMQFLEYSLEMVLELLEKAKTEEEKDLYMALVDFL